MTIQKNITKIRNHKGPIFVGMLIKDDVLYVQVIKADLLCQLKNTDEDQISVTVEDNGDMIIHPGR